MPKTRRYPPSIRERAGGSFQHEHEYEYTSQWATICSIAEKSDLNRETLRQWVRQAERDTGRRPGLTTDERQRLSDLEREVKELRAPTRPSRLRLFSRGSSTRDRRDGRVHRRAQDGLGSRADQQGVADPQHYYAARKRPPSARGARAIIRHAEEVRKRRQDVPVLRHQP